MNRHQKPSQDSEVDAMALFADAMVNGAAGAIERQEADGQRRLCASCRIPKDGPWSELIKLGVKMGEAAGDLFYSATLPEGWALKPTDHSMWSNLINAEGKKVASVFYKAAFYDRSAFFSMCK